MRAFTVLGLLLALCFGSSALADDARTAGPHAGPPANLAAYDGPCNNGNSLDETCVRAGDPKMLILSTGGYLHQCLIRYVVDWGDGSPQEENVPDTPYWYPEHVYPVIGSYSLVVTAEVLGGESWCFEVDWSESMTVRVVRKPAVGAVAFRDVDGSPLEFLSADTHPYFGGNTRLHGSITILGAPGDQLDDLDLELESGSARVAARLTASAKSQLLNVEFGSDGKITVPASTRLFLLPSSQAQWFDSETNDTISLKLVAWVHEFGTVDKQVTQVPLLVRYKGTNRYGPRDEAIGGDDWVKPSVRRLVEKYPGNTWGDLSNMNGGPFPPHAEHRTGNSIDGHFIGYNPRNGATASKVINQLNKPQGSRITKVLVTYNKPGGTVFANRPSPDPFWLAIKDVILADGRAAKAVIRPAADHATHFHWDVAD